MHQHRFGVIVGGVGGGNFPGQSAQKCVSGIPGGSFQPFFAGNDVPPSYGQRNIVAVTELTDELLVPVRFFPTQMMVKVRRPKVDAQFFS